MSKNKVRFPLALPFLTNSCTHPHANLQAAVDDVSSVHAPCRVTHSVPANVRCRRSLYRTVARSPHLLARLLLFGALLRTVQSCPIGRSMFESMPTSKAMLKQLIPSVNLHGKI